MATTIDLLRGILTLDTSRWSSGIGSASTRFQDFISRSITGFARVGLAISGFEQTVGRLARFVSGLTSRFAQYGDELAKASVRTGVAVEQLSALRHVADLSDVDFGQLLNSIRFLQRGMSEASRGIGTAHEAFTRLGISATNAEGLLRSTLDVMLDVADRINALGSEAERTETAMDLFGRSGTILLPMFTEGARGIRELMEEARELGLVLSQEDARAAEQLNDDITRLKASLAGLQIDIGRELAPIINEFVNEMREWIQANRELFAQQLAEFIGALILVARQFIELLLQLTPVLTFLAQHAFPLLGLAIGRMFGPWGKLIGLIVGLIAELGGLEAALTALGVTIGFVVGGPLGALLGLIAGLVIDLGTLGDSFETAGERAHQSGQIMREAMEDAAELTDEQLRARAQHLRQSAELTRSMLRADFEHIRELAEESGVGVVRAMELARGGLLSQAGLAIEAGLADRETITELTRRIDELGAEAQERIEAAERIEEELRARQERTREEQQVAAAEVASRVPEALGEAQRRATERRFPGFGEIREFADLGPTADEMREFLATLEDVSQESIDAFIAIAEQQGAVSDELIASFIEVNAAERARIDAEREMQEARARAAEEVATIVSEEEERFRDELANIAQSLADAGVALDAEQIMQFEQTAHGLFEEFALGSISASQLRDGLAELTDETRIAADAAIEAANAEAALQERRRLMAGAFTEEEFGRAVEDRLIALQQQRLTELVEAFVSEVIDPMGKAAQRWIKLQDEITERQRRLEEARRKEAAARAAIFDAFAQGGGVRETAATREFFARQARRFGGLEAERRAREVIFGGAGLTIGAIFPRQRQQRREVARFQGGGLVPGSVMTDQIIAGLSSGEFVVRREAVERVGVTTLQRLNRGDMGGLNPQNILVTVNVPADARRLVAEIERELAMRGASLVRRSPLGGA